MSEMQKKKRFLRRLPPWVELPIIALVAVIFVAFGTAILWATLTPLPAINNFENRQVAQSTKIYDRTGNIVLYDVHGSVRRTSVGMDGISDYIKKATVATEDDTFYTNNGFRPLSFLRATFVNVTSGGYRQGGSTITQQVVKNALLTQDKTILRKIEEIILALRLTKAYSKDEILNTYLNETSYGGTVYGVQEASQYFFGVDAKDVDLAQSAYLAAIPQAPTHFSPYGNYKDELDARQQFVLGRMRDLGLVTSEEYTQAATEQVQFTGKGESGIKAPHFVFYIRDYLEQKYGVDAVNDGGLRVVTTLDYGLQQKAEDVVTKWAPQMMQNFNASNEGLVAVDPKTGQVLAMVGSKDYFNDDIDGQVNVTLANRQPGSSFKPFVYATALKEGYTPSTVVFDLPTQFSTACAPQDNLNDTPPCYSPSNFDGTFKGPMTLRNAIAQSENVPSVKTLYLAGIKESLATAADMGITTLGDANQYGLTLVLGGGEVTLLEMTSAYGVFANDGLKNAPIGILSVTDGGGHTLERYAPNPQRVLDPQVARQMNDILSDNVARTPEFGADSPLLFHGYDVADKTGTTNDFRDVWILGYTPAISVGAWAGNNDNSPMAKKIAAFIIAPMWHDFMEQALEQYSSPSDTFPPPDPDPNIASLPPVLTGNWNTDPAQGVHDILYWIQKDNPRGGRPTNPANDSQFAYWDYPVQLWASGNAQSFLTSPTTVTSASSAPENNFRITSPQQGASILRGSVMTLSITNQSSIPVSSVSYYVDNALVGTAGAPYTVVYTPTLRGSVTLRAVGVRPDGSSIEQSLTFTVQ